MEIYKLKRICYLFIYITIIKLWKNYSKIDPVTALNSITTRASQRETKAYPKSL